MKQVVTSNCSIHKVAGRRIRSSRPAWAVIRRDLASSSVLCCCNKTLTKSNLREPWVCPTLPCHSPPLRDSKARTQGKNLEQKPKQRPCRNTAFWRAAQACLATFPICPSPTCPRLALPTEVWSLSTAIRNKKMPPPAQICSQAELLDNSSSKFPLHRWLHCVKQTNTKTHCIKKKKSSSYWLLVLFTSHLPSCFLKIFYTCI